MIIVMSNSDPCKRTFSKCKYVVINANANNNTWLRLQSSCLLLLLMALPSVSVSSSSSSSSLNYNINYNNNHKIVTPSSHQSQNEIGKKGMESLLLFGNNSNSEEKRRNMRGISKIIATDIDIDIDTRTSSDGDNNNSDSTIANTNDNANDNHNTGQSKRLNQSLDQSTTTSTSTTNKDDNQTKRIIILIAVIILLSIAAIMTVGWMTIFYLRWSYNQQIKREEVERANAKEMQKRKQQQRQHQQQKLNPFQHNQNHIMNINMDLFHNGNSDSTDKEEDEEENCEDGQIMSRWNRSFLKLKSTPTAANASASSSKKSHIDKQFHPQHYRVVGQDPGDGDTTYTTSRYSNTNRNNNNLPIMIAPHSTTNSYSRRQLQQGHHQQLHYFPPPPPPPEYEHDDDDNDSFGKELETAKQIDYHNYMKKQRQGQRQGQQQRHRPQQPINTLHQNHRTVQVLPSPNQQSETPKNTIPKPTTRSSSSSSSSKTTTTPRTSAIPKLSPPKRDVAPIQIMDYVRNSLTQGMNYMSGFVYQDHPDPDPQTILTLASTNTSSASDSDDSTPTSTSSYGGKNISSSVEEEEGRNILRNHNKMKNGGNDNENGEGDFFVMPSNNESDEMNAYLLSKKNYDNGGGDDDDDDQSFGNNSGMEMSLGGHTKSSTGVSACGSQSTSTVNTITSSVVRKGFHSIHDDDQELMFEYIPREEYDAAVLAAASVIDRNHGGVSVGFGVGGSGKRRGRENITPKISNSLRKITSGDSIDDSDGAHVPSDQVKKKQNQPQQRPNGKNDNHFDNYTMSSHSLLSSSLDESEEHMFTTSPSGQTNIFDELKNASIFLKHYEKKKEAKRQLKEKKQYHIPPNKKVALPPKKEDIADDGYDQSHNDSIDFSNSTSSPESMETSMVSTSISEATSSIDISSNPRVLKTLIPKAKENTAHISNRSIESDSCQDEYEVCGDGSLESIIETDTSSRLGATPKYASEDYLAVTNIGRITTARAHKSRSDEGDSNAIENQPSKTPSEYIGEKAQNFRSIVAGLESKLETSAVSLVSMFNSKRSSSPTKAESSIEKEKRVSFVKYGSNREEVSNNRTKVDSGETSKSHVTGRISPTINATARSLISMFESKKASSAPITPQNEYWQYTGKLRQQKR